MNLGLLLWAFRSSGSTAWKSANTPIRLTSKFRQTESGDVARTDSAVSPMAALAITVSIYDIPAGFRVSIAAAGSVGTEQSILMRCSEVPAAVGRSLRLWDTAACGSRTAAMTVWFGRVRIVVKMPRPIPRMNAALVVACNRGRKENSPRLGPVMRMTSDISSVHDASIITQIEARRLTKLIARIETHRYKHFTAAYHQDFKRKKLKKHHE